MKNRVRCSIIKQKFLSRISDIKLNKSNRVKNRYESYCYQLCCNNQRKLLKSNLFSRLFQIFSFNETIVQAFFCLSFLLLVRFTLPLRAFGWNFACHFYLEWCIFWSNRWFWLYLVYFKWWAVSCHLSVLVRNNSDENKYCDI